MKVLSALGCDVFVPGLPGPSSWEGLLCQLDNNMIVRTVASTFPLFLEF